MTLAEASKLALAAAEAGDLSALEQALTARAHAIAAGEIASPDSFEAGEQTFQLLEALLRSVRMESMRLAKIQAGFSCASESGVRMNYQGKFTKAVLRPPEPPRR